MFEENDNEDNLNYEEGGNEENNEEQENDQMNMDNENMEGQQDMDNDGEEEDSLGKKEEEMKISDDNINMDNMNSQNQDMIDNEPNKIGKNQDPKVNKLINSMKKKNKNQLYEQEEIKQKNENNEKFSTDELFKKAIEKKSNKVCPLELDNEGNSLSTKITEVLYDKFVGKNIQKSKHLDIYSKIKDEEIRQGREATRTKNDAKRINNMIVRQEDYEKLKSDKKKGRQREIKNKINEVCVFIPNGKKNMSSRNPNKFFDDQKKFMEEKEESIHKMTQDVLDKEIKNANVPLVSKNSEKLANSKNPSESSAQFIKRLTEEKLKNTKRVIEVPKEEKKLTKKELDDLTEKLHKEGQTFKNNRIKMEQEQIDKMKKLEKNDFVLMKSKKVLFDKFISNYNKILVDLFDKKDNFPVNYDEYKNILSNLGFIKTNSPKNENLIKESFNNYLKPTEEKIDTNAFLLFGLAVLGIYKGNDEKIEDHSSKVSVVKPEEEKEEENQNENNEKPKENKIGNINNPNKKSQTKTSLEMIKSYLPNLDFEKYGFSGKECKNIKNKFFPFVSGISESWAKDLFKKKQERQDKLEETNKKMNLEESKRLENKHKKEEEFVNSYLKKVLKKELFTENNDENNEDDKDKEKESNINTTKSFKVENMYEILQKKKQRELDNLKAKQEEDILQECTFQPNSKTKPVDKKEVSKNIEKLYLEGKESYMKKLQQEEKDLDLNSENEKNCTFKPVIQDYRGYYFDNNPLKEDKSFNNEIKKKEKIREEKGYTGREIKKPMAFGIEPKSNKEDIYKRVIPNRAEKIVRNVKNEFEDYSGFDDQGNQSFIKIEVKLDNNKTELLTIYPGDDYIKIVDAFCNKHGFKEEKRIRLIRVIKDKMRKNNENQ